MFVMSYFKAASCSRSAAILASASACLVRSLATTFSGADETNLSFESFFARWRGILRGIPVRLRVFAFGLDVDHALHRYEVLRGLYEESDGRRIFSRVVSICERLPIFCRTGRIPPGSSRRRSPGASGVFLRNVFLLADVADGRYDLFRQFEPAQQRLVYLPCFGHALDHDRLACLAGVPGPARSLR